MLKTLTVWITTNCGKFLKKWEYQTILPEKPICRTRSTVRTENGSLEQDMEYTGSKLGKDYVKAIDCHPDYLTYVQSTSWDMPGWMKYKLESRLLGEISTTSDKLCRKWRGTKEPLDERGEWKRWLIIQPKILVSSLITSWQVDGETKETVTDFISLGSKITAAGDCSHEIKGRLLLGRKAMTNLDSILKSRNITLPTKVHA